MKKEPSLSGEKTNPMFILYLTKFLAEIGVTDIYLSVGAPLSVRYRTEVKPLAKALAEYLNGVGEKPLEPKRLEELREKLPFFESQGMVLAQDYVLYIMQQLWSIKEVDPLYIAPLFKGYAMDLGIALQDGYRARVHAFFSMSLHEKEDLVRGPRSLEEITEDQWYALGSQLRFVIRVIPPLPNSIAELGLHPTLESQFLSQKGLYLITGPTASGKTTTLAYLTHKASTTMPWHIVTLEDPIEYYIPSYIATGSGSLVHQREKGKDFDTFPKGMAQALRESPDLIVIGEIRDEETLNWTIFLAEAGFTVLATYHSANFPETVYRIASSFPKEQEGLILGRLAQVLKAVVSQRLIKGKGGMRLIYEYVPVDEKLAKLIREGNYATYTTPYPWENSIDALLAASEIGKAEAISYRSAVGAVGRRGEGLFRS